MANPDMYDNSLSSSCKLTIGLSIFDDTICSVADVTHYTGKMEIQKVLRQIYATEVHMGVGYSPLYIYYIINSCYKIEEDSI